MFKKLKKGYVSVTSVSKAHDYYDKKEKEELMDFRAKLKVMSIFARSSEIKHHHEDNINKLDEMISQYPVRF